MKKTPLILYTFLLSLCLVNCVKIEEKPTEPSFEALEFGYHNYSWVSICNNFKWEPTRLFQSDDPCESSNQGPYSYHVELSADKFVIADELAHSLTPKQLDRPSALYMSNCADCGTYYLTIVRQGKKTTWEFGGELNNKWPQEVQTMFLALYQALDHLKR